MAIRFQYNKTSLQSLEKQLKVRVRALPTIKSKESALRLEVKRSRAEVERLEEQMLASIGSYEKMAAMWCEFDVSLLEVEDVKLSSKKIAGVVVPILEEVIFIQKPYSRLLTPLWYEDGIVLLKQVAQIGIEAEIEALRLTALEHARKKTTQKVNLFEKVQIPGFQEAIRKIKRFMEDEESLSKSSQKIMRANIEKREAKEKEAQDD